MYRSIIPTIITQTLKQFEELTMMDKVQDSVSSPINILLIEDNEHDRAAFERALRKSETAFKISVCERAEEALDKLAASKNSFDLVVVDYDLPGMNGMDFYRRQQHTQKLPPFVMLTGAGSENLAVEALQAGMYDYIIKDPGQGYLKLLPLKLADVKQRKADRRARRRAQAALKKAHDELERRIAKRTAELSLTIQILEKEVEEHQQARQQIKIAYDALNSTASGIIITDSDLRIRFANPACLHMFKFDRLDDIVGIKAVDLFSAQKVKELADVKLVVQQSMGPTQELSVQCADGTAFPVEVSFSEVTDSEGAVVGKMASLIDITVRKRTEDALKQSERRLRKLSRKILESQENERKLVAREIHDSISGDLAAIKICLEEKLHQMDGDPPEDTVSIEQIISTIDNTIQETRRISSRLRPMMLDDLGLVSTLDWFCREFEKYHPGIHLERRFEIEEDDVPEQLKVVIYRILQEAMNNVARHSEADRTLINLVNDENELKLRIEDNGRGLDFERISSNHDPMSGYGLANMRDRAEICGGNFKISSEPGAGTTIHLTLPRR
jgi:PAS domain S-box-containing protein